MQYVKDGDEIWYSPRIGGPKFAGVARGDMFALFHCAAVVHLRDMEPAYGEYVGLPGKTHVHAAALTHLEPRRVALQERGK